MIVEIPVLKFLIAFARVRPTIFGRTGHNSLLAFLQSSLIFVTYLISGHFRSFFFEGAHQFWASVAKGVGVSNPHSHSVKSCPKKSRPIKYGGQMHGVMIAIEYIECINPCTDFGL